MRGFRAPTPFTIHPADTATFVLQKRKWGKWSDEIVYDTANEAYAKLFALQLEEVKKKRDRRISR